MILDVVVLRNWEFRWSYHFRCVSKHTCTPQLFTISSYGAQMRANAPLPTAPSLASHKYFFMFITECVSQDVIFFVNLDIILLKKFYEPLPLFKRKRQRKSSLKSRKERGCYNTINRNVTQGILNRITWHSYQF